MLCKEGENVKYYSATRVLETLCNSDGTSPNATHLRSLLYKESPSPLPRHPQHKNKTKTTEIGVKPRVIGVAELWGRRWWQKNNTKTTDIVSIPRISGHRVVYIQGVGNFQVYGIEWDWLKG